MTADLTGKVPPRARRIRISTNLQIYWNSILIDRAVKIRTSVSRQFRSLAPICAFTDFR